MNMNGRGKFVGCYKGVEGGGEKESLGRRMKRKREKREKEVERYRERERESERE
jgi:hypothetical protein